MCAQKPKLWWSRTTYLPYYELTIVSDQRQFITSISIMEYVESKSDQITRKLNERKDDPSPFKFIRGWIDFTVSFLRFVFTADTPSYTYRRCMLRLCSKGRHLSPPFYICSSTVICPYSMFINKS